MESPGEGSTAEIENLKKRISTMEAMIIQLFRLYYDLAISLAEQRYKEPPNSI